MFTPAGDRLFTAELEFLRASRDEESAYDETQKRPGDQLTRRRWLEVLARKELALKALKRAIAVINDAGRTPTAVAVDGTATLYGPSERGTRP